MNRDALMKYKKMFEEQKRKLIYSHKLVDENFHLSKDDLMDEADVTSFELENSMRMRLRNREALFLKKIEQALDRISDGSFGECQECGEDIDLRRLEARPTSTLCVLCKEEQEHREMMHIDGWRPKSVGTKMRFA